LHPDATAASVRIRNGTPLVTVGPFAEPTEQLGGFFLIDVPNLDDAIATLHPGATVGSVEVRQVVDLASLPERNMS